MNCPHGDPTCPCQDYGRLEADGTVNRDTCHYEGADPEPCPRQTFMVDEDGAAWTTGYDYSGTLRAAGWPHCHVEGCPWTGRANGDCGLTRIHADREISVSAALDLGCGLIRALALR